jgi:ribonuclease HI
MNQMSFGDAKVPGKEQSEWITAYCDGGSRGNPGPAGFGVYIQDENGTVVAELSEYLGRKTNNYAEYSGLLAALQFAIDNDHPRLKVISDSELMVKQLKGQYRVNSPELRLLYDEAKRRIAKLQSFQAQHVLREKNKQADRLANLAMDRGTGKSAPDVASRLPPRDPATAKPCVADPPKIPIVRLSPTVKPESRPLRGFVKGGVIHLVEGELPDGVFVKIVRE